LSLCAFVSIAAAQVTGDECLFCHRNDIGSAWQKNRHRLTIRSPENAAQGEFLLGGRGRVRRLKQQGYGRFAILSGGKWDSRAFGERCARCHTSGYDAVAKTFTAAGVECYSCHADVDLAHSTDPSRVALSKQRRTDARAVAAICRDCHLRDGNTPADTHVRHNLRDESGVTCLTCHQVHAGSSAKHRRAARSAICEECHRAAGPMKEVRRYTVTSATCDY
jgi:predicted CXXCH cytochrome family protein